MGMNLCRGCGLTFGTLKAFDAHRTGPYGEPIYKPSRTRKSRQVIGHTAPTRRCMTVPEIQALGMTQDRKGWWMLPVPQTKPHGGTEKSLSTEEAMSS
jgi:hypothetical protein